MKQAVFPGRGRASLVAASALALAAGASCGTPPSPVAAPAPTAAALSSAPATASDSGPPDLSMDRDAATGPRGETAELKKGAVVIHRPHRAPQTVAAGDLHAAPGDRSLLGIWPRELLFLDDGTLLIGADDGTITAVDSEGNRRFTLGLRGVIRGMVRATGDLAVVTTDRGVMALVTATGRARWERQITAEKLSAPVVMRGPNGEPKALLASSLRGVFGLSLDGKEIFTHAAPFDHHDCPRSRSTRGEWTPPPSAETCTERPDDPPAVEPPKLEVDGDEIVVGSALRFHLDSPHPPVPSLAHVFPLGFAQVLTGDVVSILPDGPAAVLALVCHAGRDYGYYEAALIAHLRHKCKIVRVAESVTEVATVPETTVKPVTLVKGESLPKEPNELVIDAMILGPAGRPWILARRISFASFGGEDGYSGPPGGAGLILELSGGKVTERKDLIEDFAGQLVWLPIVGVSDAHSGLIGWGNSSAVRKQGSYAVVQDGDVGVIESASLIAGRPWFAQGGEVRRVNGPTYQTIATPKDAYVAAVAGVSETDVWADAVQYNGLLHYDGKQWSEVPSPPAVGGLFARAADDVWSGRMRWNGKRWSLVNGAPDASVVFARSADDVWMGNPLGLWHGTAPGPQPIDLAATPADEGLPASTPLVLGDKESRYVVEASTPALAKAAQRTAAVAGTAVAGTAAVTGTAASAPAGPLWALLGAPGPDSRDKAAISVREKALTLWEDTGPHARVKDGGAWRPVLGLPSAAWMAVADASDGGAWFAGGLGPGPSGEGILFHATGRLGAASSTRVRAAASLLAVAAVGQSEAWAVGAGGTIVHVRDGSITRQTLPSGEWLRAVLVAEDGVWMGGDEGTLLHHDGTTWRVVTQPLGGHAAFTGLVSAGGAVWASGPSGVVKIVKSPGGASGPATPHTNDGVKTP